MSMFKELSKENKVMIETHTAEIKKSVWDMEESSNKERELVMKKIYLKLKTINQIKSSMESLTNKYINEKTEYLSWKTMQEKLTIKEVQK